MKKITFTLAIAVLGLVTTEAIAQDKTPDTQQTERKAENINKEADALKTRIEQYTVKVEANKDNASVDYEAELVRIAEWKAKWESMTGKTWAEREEQK